MSGFDSGAFMTSELFVAKSSLFEGVGIISGGPYNCVNHLIENHSAEIKEAKEICHKHGHNIYLEEIYKFVNT